MITYQDFAKIKDTGSLAKFVGKVIDEYRGSLPYKTALAADEYDAERNVTILEFARTIFSATGQKIPDETASNMKLTSNFFARLNTQRCTYSLGNGLTFQDKNVGKKLGANSDKIIKDAGYFSLIHGEVFLYWAYDHIHVFKITEFAPLVDEENGGLGAGVRFWQMVLFLCPFLEVVDTNVEFIDNSDEVLAALQAAKERALEKCGLTAEGYAKRLCPVDTSNLRNSITHATDSHTDAAYVGTDSEYGPYVELGTGKYVAGGRPTPWAYQDAKGNWHMTHGQRAKPFIKPAVADHQQTYHKIIHDELKGY